MEENELFLRKLSLRDYVQGRKAISLEQVILGSGNLKVIRERLKSRPPITTETILAIISLPPHGNSSRNKLEILEMILQHYQGNQEQSIKLDWEIVLVSLAKLKHHDPNTMRAMCNLVIGTCQKTFFDLSFQDNRLLCTACAKGNIVLVEILLALSNLEDEHLNGKIDPTCRLNYPICKASERGFLPIVKLLVQDGRADLQARNNGPIRYAKIHGHFHIVEYLTQVISNIIKGEDS